MDRETYRIYSGQSPRFEKNVVPVGARVQVLGLDKSLIPGCMVTEAGWYKQDCIIPGLVKYASGKVILFMGSDRERPNELNAEIEFWIENDKFTLTQSCAVWVPAGAACGNVRVSNLKKPVSFFAVQPTTDVDVPEPAEATAAPGTYAANMVERFEPSNGKLPNAPEGLLTLVVWIDGGRIAGAPYAEGVWFNKVNDEGPEPHTHDYDEFLSFIGTDVEHPEELGCEVDFYIEDEPVKLTESCLLYVPAGVKHSPFFIHNMTRPILHTSGYAGGDYQRG